MSTTISGDTGITFPDATTQSKAVSQATPFAVTASSGAGAQLQLPEATANGSNYVALKSPDSLSSNLTFTLPTADGTNGQVLQTNGSGALTFGTVATVSIEGPAAGSTLYANTAQTFTITNFDSYTTYTLVTSNGTVTRSGSTITYTPATVAASASFTVNGVVVGPFVIQTLPAGQQAYTTPGTYTWVCPAGITSVSVVAVGGGGRGGQQPYYNGAGSGGGLGYKNNIAVVPGTSYTVVVGAAGTSDAGYAGDSYFSSAAIVKGGGGLGPALNVGGDGSYNRGGDYVGDGGGNGGIAGRNGQGSNGYAGGGGAGGYSGSGGAGGGLSLYSGVPQAGAGGGGGGGSIWTGNQGSGGGGGVGILGQGSNGAAGSSGQSSTAGGGGGSGGTAGGSGKTYGYDFGGPGGGYGGGGGGNYNSNTSPANQYGTGAGGAVRIIWAGGTGITRAFPSTNTGDL